MMNDKKYMPTKQAIQMRKMRENGASYKEIAEKFNTTTERARSAFVYTKNIKDDDEFLMELEDVCIARRLARAGVHTKEDLYALVEEHKYIDGIGKKSLEVINAKIDRKICAMAPKLINIHFMSGQYGRRTVIPLQFMDEAIKKKRNKAATWKFIEDDIFAGYHVCSNCKTKAFVDLYGQELLTKYCPNCGKKMEMLENDR